MKNPRAPTKHHTAQFPCAFLAVAAIAILLSWNVLPRVQASAGELNPAFGSGGKVMTDFPSYDKDFSFAVASALALQPDGKLLVAGYLGRV